MAMLPPLATSHPGRLSLADRTAVRTCSHHRRKRKCLVCRTPITVARAARTNPGQPQSRRVHFCGSCKDAIHAADAVAQDAASTAAAAAATGLGRGASSQKHKHARGTARAHHAVHAHRRGSKSAPAATAPARSASARLAAATAGQGQGQGHSLSATFSRMFERGLESDSLFQWREVPGNGLVWLQAASPTSWRVGSKGDQSAAPRPGLGLGLNSRAKRAGRQAWARQPAAAAVVPRQPGTRWPRPVALRKLRDTSALASPAIGLPQLPSISTTK